MLTWTRAFTFSESVQPHLIAKERCTGLEATRGRPMHGGVDKSTFIGGQPVRDQDVGIQFIRTTCYTVRPSAVCKRTLHRCELTRLEVQNIRRWNVCEVACYAEQIWCWEGHRSSAADAGLPTASERLTLAVITILGLQLLHP